MNRALHAPDHVPIEPAALRAQVSTVSGGEVFCLDPSLSLVASPWPIDRIWRANQPDADPDVTVALSTNEIDENFDLAYHLKHVDTIFVRVFGQD